MLRSPVCPGRHAGNPTPRRPRVARRGEYQDRQGSCVPDREGLRGLDVTALADFRKDGRMKAWVKRHPLSSYFLVAYTVSWSIAVPLALQAQGLFSRRLPWSLHYLTMFGPAAAACLIRWLVRESGASERAEPWAGGRPTFWWAVAFVSPLLLFVIASIAARIAGRMAPTWTSLGHVNYLPHLGLARGDSGSSPVLARSSAGEDLRCLVCSERIPR
jgi:hypothetical protein